MKRSLILTAFSLALVSAVPAIAQDAPTATDPNAGAYDALSPGEKSIVDAIYESHLEATATESTTTDGTTANGSETTETMTPDDIAAMKADGGWGKTYNELYDQGKVSYRNLGQAVSAYKRSLNPSTTETATVVTTGNGQQIMTGGRKSAGTTSASANATNQGGGKKLGQNKPTTITTGGGASAGSGSTTLSSAGGASGLGGAGGARGRGSGGVSHR